MKQFRTTPLIGVLICSTILVLIGVYLTIKSKVVKGLSLPYDDGYAPWRPYILSGWFMIVLGIGIGAYPLYLLIRKNKSGGES
jgi:hypothetical protein